MPNIDMAQVGNWIIYLLIGLLIAGLLAVTAYLIIDSKKYNKIIVLFKRVNGKPQKYFVDKGMFERIGQAGDYWLRTKRMKKILARPKIETAKNEFWYWEREDGEWINFTIEDIDEVQKKAKAYFVDEDMRLQRVGIQKNLEQRYNKQSFWEKYGTLIGGLIFVIIVTICLVVLFNNLGKLTKALPELASSLNNIANTMRDIMTRTQSGAIPINSTTLR